MTSRGKRDCVVSVRLTPADLASIAAQAAEDGKNLSKYIEGVLLEEVRRPRPTLAAAGALLAICRSLIDAVDKGDLRDETRELARGHANLVFEILRQHGHRG